MIDIYIITNMINGKEYVGITKRGYMKRFKDHLRCSDNNDSSRNRYVLYRAMRKHGKDNFKIELLEQTDTYNDAKLKEVEYISKFKTYYKDDINWGYNMTKGGDGKGISYISEAQRNKLRKASLNLHKNEEYRAKFLKAARSPEKRMAISIANTGAKNGMYGNGHLVSGDKNYWYGRKGELHCQYGKSHSDEVKEKLRQSTLKCWRDEDYKDKNLKHLKDLGEKQKGLSNPSAKKTYLYDKEFNLIHIGTMKDICKIVDCCHATLKKNKDANVLINNFYVFSYYIEQIN